MTRHLHPIVPIVLGLAIVIGAPSLVVADRCAGVSMPSRIEVDGEVLVLNGLGLREATIFRVDVMVVGLYLPEPSDDAEAILAANGRKRLRLHLLRDVSRDKMGRGMGDAFEAAGATAGFSRFLELLPEELPEGTRIELTHQPGRGLEVRVDHRRRGLVRGDRFATRFFATFLGASSPSPQMTRGLLGGECD